MKNLIILLLCFNAFGQTTYEDVDIDAAAGNQYETLLTNVEYGNNDSAIQAYLQKIGMADCGAKFSKDTPTEWQYKFQKKIVSGVEQQGYVNVKFTKKKIAKYDLPMTTKVEITGDPQKVIQFFCGFWSTSLNFADVKFGEVVSSRFLSDVATLTFPDSKTAKITVVTAKDRI
ncbi:hypothetical protein [Flavobacterium cerinum]|uniref:Uncharacterized protein n=1 Tax=Flavobacterium cerinum TaxID=2502784 RepID=A0A3S3QMK7_9FLAO|nr:hypothetical protein [Flavobacterium cerinum]RWX03377.1 hypothetical protein EPI11_00160 [Flavobacterium cerinum]